MVELLTLILPAVVIIVILCMSRNKNNYKEVNKERSKSEERTTLIRVSDRRLTLGLNESEDFYKKYSNELIDDFKEENLNASLNLGISYQRAKLFRDVYDEAYLCLCARYNFDGLWFEVKDDWEEFVRYAKYRSPAKHQEVIDGILFFKDVKGVGIVKRSRALRVLIRKELIEKYNY